MRDRIDAILRGDAATLPTGAAGDALLAQARAHRVHLLIAWCTRQGPTDLERLGGGWRSLAEEMRVEALTDARREVEVARVVAALEAAGAAPVVFKGAALARSHYPEPWLRPRLDTDLLIAPDRREAAFGALRALGYERPPFVSGERVMHQAPFVRSDGGVEHVLDVHWRIANVEVVARVLGHADVHGRSRQVLLHGHPVRVPSTADALLLALLHRVAHHADSEERLWLYDVHLLSEALDAAGWAHVVGTARAHAVTAMCARGLELARGAFRTAVPAEVIGALASRAGEEPSAVYLRPHLRPVDRLLAEWRALGPRAGLALLREHLLPPPQYIASRYGVRWRALLPLLYARRVVVGAGKWFVTPR